jgi:hypothetical protein
MDIWAHSYLRIYQRGCNTATRKSVSTFETTSLTFLITEFFTPMNRVSVSNCKQSPILACSGMTMINAVLPQESTVACPDIFLHRTHQENTISLRPLFRVVLSHPIIGLGRPLRLQQVDMHRISAQEGRLYHHEIPGTYFCYSLRRSQGHSAAGRINSVKNLNDPTRNRTGDLPVRTAVR